MMMVIKISDAVTNKIMKKVIIFYFSTTSYFQQFQQPQNASFEYKSKQNLNQGSTFSLYIKINKDN